MIPAFILLVLVLFLIFPAPFLLVLVLILSALWCVLLLAVYVVASLLGAITNLFRPRQTRR